MAGLLYYIPGPDPQNAIGFKVDQARKQGLGYAFDESQDRWRGAE